MQSWFPMEQDSFHRTGNTFLLNCLSATLCSCFSSAATCAWKKFIFSMFINCQCEQNLSFSFRNVFKNSAPAHTGDTTGVARIASDD